MAKMATCIVAFALWNASTCYAACIAPEVDIPTSGFLRLVRHIGEGFSFLRLGGGDGRLLVTLPESTLYILW